MKLNLLHFQLNNLVSLYYPNLWVKWKNGDLNSEILFSSFLISLFTSFLEEENWYLFEFWDIIITERWKGMVKCIMYIIEANYEELNKVSITDTLKFFTEIKNDNTLSKKMKKRSFKEFVESFVFDEDLYKDLENRYTIIKESIKII